VTLTQRADVDILDIHFGEMEGPDTWVEYTLAPLMPLRDELMDGDLRSLYIVWLAALREMGSYDEEEAGDEVGAPPIPAGLASLTDAHETLIELLQVPEELVAAAARHSALARTPAHDDFAEWLERLPDDRRASYLLRLAHTEPELRRKLVTELRALQPDTGAPQSMGERVTYASLLSVSRAIKVQIEAERRERERQKRERHLRYVHDHANDYWLRITEAAERGSGPGYDEAANLLVEMREVAGHFNDTAQFWERYQAWVSPHLRRPAFVKRLQAQYFPIPLH
jgi:hypothetical protein